MSDLRPQRLKAAWVVAVTVDALQLGLIPISGGFSTLLLDKPLDILAMVILWRLLGWHWILLPTFVFEFLPFADWAPTWTATVWYLSRASVHQPHVPGPQAGTIEHHDGRREGQGAPEGK